jgi:hypothetical protein
MHLALALNVMLSCGGHKLGCDVLDGLGKSCSAVIRVGDKNYSSVSQQSYGDISGITVDGVISNSKAAVYIKHSAITSKHITCENITAVEGEGLKLDYPDSFYE